jgi:cytidylate kinase
MKREYTEQNRTKHTYIIRIHRMAIYEVAVDYTCMAYEGTVY